MIKRRINAIYAPLACVALALALYSCSEPPAQQQPTPTPAPNFVPLPDDAQFTQITAGKYHACGLQADGRALCWGHNINGSLELPGGNPIFSRVSAGLNFACALREDGAIVCWGQNDVGQAAPPNGRFDEIAAGRDHACALDDGALVCWGAEFPDGPETIQEVPPLSAIQTGFGLTCGLTPDADMACLSSGDRKLDITPGPFADIGISLHHACAIKVDGNAFCGGNTWDIHPPPTKFVQMSGGWHHACGITEASDIECWGSGVRGVPGERLSAPEGKFTAVSIGWRNSCALNPDGYAVCWQQPDIQNPSELPEAFGGVKFDWPMDLFPLPDGRLAVVERNGVITAYSDEPNGAPPEVMLDISDIILSDELIHDGVSAAALDPQFEEFPFLYVYYRVLDDHPAEGEDITEFAGRLQVARFRVEAGQAVRDSMLIILEVAQPNKSHYAGAIRFGPDGMLYIATGSNSSGWTQSLQTLNGKILRIDVRGATPKRPYRIPPGNPFVDEPEALPEIWIYGMKNPWRMDFAPDGRLFIADVGIDTQEEISLAGAGANLGAYICEGNLCEEGWESDADGFTAPIFTYGRDDGCAVIGGVTVPRLGNGFVFGDYCSKRVWLLEQDEREGWKTRILAPRLKGQILSFGMDVDGTVYALIRRNPIVRLQLEEVSESEE